jgi:hypothetical protein
MAIPFEVDLIRNRFVACQIMHPRRESCNQNVAFLAIDVRGLTKRHDGRAGVGNVDLQVGQGRGGRRAGAAALPADAGPSACAPQLFRR